MRAWLLTATILAAAAGARADDETFERRGRNVLALEGIAGAASYRRAYPQSGLEPVTQTRFGVLGTMPFSRLGYHRFVVRGFSVGAGLQVSLARFAYYDAANATVWSVAPRLGYAATVAGATALWLRAGPSILYATSTNTSSGQISLAAEAILVVPFSADLAATMMMFVESGVSGRERDDASDTSRPVRLRTIGLNVGAEIAF